MQDNRNGNVWVWVGIVVVVLIIILAFVWKPAANNGPAAEPGVPVFATQGQVVSGFPKELILDPAAAVNSSYSINYSASANQYTAEWNSSTSMASLYASYKTYLSSNGWTITTQKSATNLDSVYATNGTSIANVAIYPQNGATRVVVSYVKQ